MQDQKTKTQEIGEPERLNVWGKYGLKAAWVATLLLGLPAVRAEFAMDDFFQRIVLGGKAPELGLGPATLYDFMGRLDGRGMLDRGFMPWLTDPELSLRFFRPLSSLSIALDHALFGRAALPSHLVTLSWFVAVTAVAIALFRELLTPNRAGLAAFLFAVAGGHAFNLTWVAGRHVLLGALFGALSVLVHVKGVRGSSPRWLPGWLAPVSLLVAAFASEMSLAAAAMIASFELIATDRPLRARLWRTVPWVVGALVYLGLYAAAGYGAQKSGLYLSPFSMPGEFLVAAVTRLPILLGDLAFGVPSFLWGAFEAAHPVLALIGVASTTLVVALAWRASPSPEGRRHTAWLSVAALLGALPVVGGVLDGRILLTSLFASVPLVATAIDGVLGQARAPLLLRLAAGALLFMHVVFALVVRLGVGEIMVSAARKQRELAESADVSQCSAAAPLFVVTGADPALCLAAGPLLIYYRPDIVARHPYLSVLSLAPHDLRIERTSPTELVLDVVGSPRRVTMFERLFRKDPLVVGQRVEVRRFSAHVLATEGGFPRRVAFELPENSCLLTLEHQKIVGRPLPAVGGAREVPHELGPMGL